MRVEKSILDSYPITVLGFERFLACGYACLVLVGLKGQVLLDLEDHGVELSGLFNEHRFALGLGAEATKAILSFCGGDAHGALLGCLAILAIDSHGRKAVRRASVSA